MRHEIRLEEPAKVWENALPIGNGRLGALIRGIPGQEIIHLNEETIWYGGPIERIGKDSNEYVPKIRELLAKGEIEEANYLARVGMYSSPKYIAPYHPAGDLRLVLRDHSGEVSDYSAVLDIDNAIATVSYKVAGINWKLEYIASRKDNVLVVHVTNSTNDVSMAANLNRRPFEEYSRKVAENTTGLWGQSGAGGVNYFGGLRIATEGAPPVVINDYVTAEHAKAVTLYITFETDFANNPTFRENSLERLLIASQKGFKKLLDEHTNDYHSLYNRLKFSINNTQTPSISTKLLLETNRKDKSTLDELTENLFHFGRYLLICGSTDCQLPANLQGIWNGSYTPPWESKYTININIQMNYWLAGLCNLSECHLPLFDLVDRMAVRGEKTAKELYNCRGFVAHHNTNIWAATEPEGVLGASPIWPMGGAWFAIHYFDYYEYTGDKQFLEKRALPIIEKAVLFYVDYLTENSKGELVTGPSLSPENTFRTKDGQVGTVCMGPTMDIQIVRQLLNSYISSCNALGVAAELLETAKGILKKLPETKITSDGRIMEWQEDYEEVELGHRHVSHLFALHPGNQITDKTPELMSAAHKSIETRLANGGGHTGWSRVWLTCMLARLKDSQQVYFHINELFKSSIMDNLFNSHPPYQIDGNYGFTAVVVEMIVQSQNGIIEIFPALPKEWQSGELLGVGLRGAMLADITWGNGEVTCLNITAKENTKVKIKYKKEIIVATLAKGVATKIELH